MKKSNTKEQGKGKDKEKGKGKEKEEKKRFIVFVGNLPFRATQQHVLEHFNKPGLWRVFVCV